MYNIVFGLNSRTFTKLENKNKNEEVVAKNIKQYGMR